jgi:hypothetical protein
MQKKEEEQVAGDEAPSSGVERIDLTKSQLASLESEGGDSTNQVDDFDLLDAKIDPKDIRTMKKVQKLHEEIEFEKTKIKMKYVFKFSFQTNDPLRISE